MAVSKKSAVPGAKTSKVIEVLNKARAMELYAISQYMNQHYGLDDQDYGQLSARVRAIAIDEMRHAEDFAERIKDLGGEPTAAIDSTVIKRQDVRDIFRFNSAVEDDTIKKYNEFIKICRDQGDQVSANLFERIIDAEQEHFNAFDDIDTHIKELKESYLARMAGGDAD